MKTTLMMLAVSLLCFLFAACATPEQTTAAIAAAGATATALVQALAPMLSPEDLAKLQATAANIDGTVEATATAVRTVADAIASIRSAGAANFAQVTDGLQKLAIQAASSPSTEAVLGYNAGTAALAVAGSRALSISKHGKIGKMAKAGA